MNSFTSFFSSVSAKLKNVVEEEQKNLKSLLNGENNAKKESKQRIVLPWDVLPSDPLKVEAMKEQIMNLTKSKRNFLNAPPEDANFSFTMDENMTTLAKACLDANGELSNSRFYLVPKYIKEPQFWRNYFYRIYVIRVSYGINEPIQLKMSEDDSNDFITPYTPQNTSIEPLKEKEAPKAKVEMQHHEEVGNGVHDEEFVSDYNHYQVNVEKIKNEVNQMMIQNKLSEKKNEQNWEEELKNELGSVDTAELDENWEELMKKELEEELTKS